MSGRASVEPAIASAMDAFVGRLREAGLPPISRVLLYGSRARGDHREDSDVDIAVVFHGQPPPRYPRHLLHQLGNVAYDVQFHRNFDVYLSPRPVFEGQLQETSSTRNPGFYRNVRQDAIEWVGGESDAG